MALAERLQAPIVHALRGKEFIEYDNPYDVGMNGLLGIRSGFEAMEHCEALLMLGTDFPYQQFYPTDAWVCQVDLRPEQLGRRARLDLGLVGNVKDTLTALLPRLQKNADSTHLETCREQFRKTSEGLLELAVPTPADGPVHPQYLAHCLSELASDNAIFTADVGTPSIWAARYLQMNGRRRLVGSWSHGSMAGALPQAIGAQLAFPARQVVTMSGDGGFAMLMGDLLSVVQHRLLYGRGTGDHWTINGYREEGTTTTPFDMLVRNGASRYHLIQQAVRAAAAHNPRVAVRAAERVSHFEYVLREFRERIVRTGRDPEEISGWQWSGR